VTKTTGLGDNFYVAGNNVSGDINSVGKVNGGPAALNMTGIDKLAYERQGTVRDGGMDFAAYFNPTGVHPVLSALPTADTLVSYCRGTSLGDAVASLNAKQIGYDGNRGEDASLLFSNSAVGNSYGLEWGVQLTPGVRTDSGATNGTGVDLVTVSTAFGWQAYLHVFAVTGTSVTVKLQDSADNAAYADLASGAFTAATAGGTWQRLQGGRTDTVRRYVRAITTGTFSSAAFAVAFVRNDTAVVF
jgi:hypothetical protein